MIFLFGRLGRSRSSGNGIWQTPASNSIQSLFFQCNLGIVKQHFNNTTRLCDMPCKVDSKRDGVKNGKQRAINRQLLRATALNQRVQHCAAPNVNGFMMRKPKQNYLPTHCQIQLVVSCHPSAQHLCQNLRYSAAGSQNKSSEQSENPRPQVQMALQAASSRYALRSCQRHWPSSHADYFWKGHDQTHGRSMGGVNFQKGLRVRPHELQRTAFDVNC